MSRFASPVPTRFLAAAAAAALCGPAAAQPGERAPVLRDAPPAA